jgi:hypothetical protein
MSGTWCRQCGAEVPKDSPLCPSCDLAFRAVGEGDEGSFWERFCEMVENYPSVKYSLLLFAFVKLAAFFILISA